MDAAATEAPTSSLVVSVANAHNVFDEIATSFNDETYISTMGVGSNNSHWSQINEVHLDDHEYEVGEDGQGVDEESNKCNQTIDLDDYEEEASSDDGKISPTPNSVAYSKPKRPNGGKKGSKEKKKRKGDDELKNAMEAIVKSRKEANKVRMLARTQDAAAEGRRLATEERRMGDEERKVALEEKKLAMEERTRLLEWEKYLFFIMDTSNVDEKQKKYVNFAREEVLVKKRHESYYGRHRRNGWHGRHGSHGWHEKHGKHGRLGSYHGRHGRLRCYHERHEFWVSHRRHGALPDDMGGRMSSCVPHIPSHDAVGDVTNTFRAPNDDAARDNEEEEEETSLDEEEESEEEEDGDEDAA
ncbi:putative receptor protein kinase ZmPK1 [Hordeum vulgare]|nr:putative receptor protein kinase ZmPK1 [Hordeum vulgare]